jgi:hypothetical protein
MNLENISIENNEEDEPPPMGWYLNPLEDYTDKKYKDYLEY